MSNLDHGKFTRVTTLFHSLLAFDVFLLFFSGYAIMFNNELWWLIVAMGGTTGVVAVHRFAGIGLIALVFFFLTLQIVSPTGRSNFKEILPSKADFEASIQDVKFALGRADERHPNARQFAGYKSDEVPLLSYIGKGVVVIFTIELVLLVATGMLIWSKTGVAEVFQSKAVAAGFVTFHGLLGVIMLMGVMFHTYEHGMHPAFYPVETKAFIPRRLIPEQHDDEDHDTTGIERLSLSPSWRTVSSVFGVLTAVGIFSVMFASIYYERYPVPRELEVVGGGPTNLLMTIGINAGILVLGIGLVLSMYGNVLRIRWEREMQEAKEEPQATADGGSTRTDGGVDSED